ncbi:hypothetical protein AC578_3222 [Pseudocercospora eumusae]|uniref:Uncharacterized protein n=1 Tax=Pseudocercospora eumusae TaxID=321146 RepID=A0A139H1W4_9PEZI|nr:hypothetical protein AC578_3222 [Pseudocercospora eumusae]
MKAHQPGSPVAFDCRRLGTTCGTERHRPQLLNVVLKYKKPTALRPIHESHLLLTSADREPLFTVKPNTLYLYTMQLSGIAAFLLAVTSVAASSNILLREDFEALDIGRMSKRSKDPWAKPDADCKSQKQGQCCCVNKKKHNNCLCCEDSGNKCKHNKKGDPYHSLQSALPSLSYEKAEARTAVGQLLGCIDAMEAVDNLKATHGSLTGVLKVNFLRLRR